ncbi:MAG: hypothetical protein LBM92_06215 [Opitutaceae bacterium]|jgi:hypothetical protein|nr:hypothetical protein [Opitutaceae bacterium]
MYHCNDWEKTKRRYAAFWGREVVDRAVICAQAIRDGSNYTRPVPEDGELERFYNDPEWMLERNLSRFENTHYAGDGFASVWVPFATGGHCCYTKGAEYQYTARTVWVHPVIKDWETNPIIFDADSKLLETHCRMLAHLCDHAKGRYLTGNYDHCGNLDSLAALRGSDNLLVDFLAEPGRVKEGVRKIQEIQKHTMDRFYKILQPANGGTVNAWMCSFCEERQIQLQCDLSVMISPAVFEEFALPDLEFYNDWPGRTIYHLDGMEQIRHLGMILSAKSVDAVQWTPVDGQPKTSHFLAELKRIQSAGKSLVIYPYPEEVELLSRELSHKGLLIKVLGSCTQDVADSLVKIVERNAHD